MTGCGCTELQIHHGREESYRVRNVIRHDCVYIQKRNALIPEAARLASLVTQRKAPEWSATFFGEMDRLVREAKARGEL